MAVLSVTRPLYILVLSSVFGAVTVVKLLATFNTKPLFSWREFRSHWFAAFFTSFGPVSAAHDAPRTSKIVGSAYGAVLDLGPGPGLTVQYLDPSKVTRAYGVEPCIGLHPELRRNVVKAGLESLYEIIPAGAEDLGKHGIENESIDTVVCCKVLCGIPEPERVLKELYSYLKPGGQFVVYEHIANQHHKPGSIFQRVLQIVWPHMLQGCNINRKTDDMLRACGNWETVELQAPEGQSISAVIPFVGGRLVKPKE